VKGNEENVWQCKAPREYVSINEPYGSLTYLKFIDTAANPDYSNPFIKNSFWKGTCVYYQNLINKYNSLIMFFFFFFFISYN